MVVPTLASQSIPVHRRRMAVQRIPDRSTLILARSIRGLCLMMRDLSIPVLCPMMQDHSTRGR